MFSKFALIVALFVNVEEKSSQQTLNNIYAAKYGFVKVNECC